MPWTCCQSLCKSRCSTRPSFEIVSSPTEHNHGLTTLDTERICKVIKEKAIERTKDSAGSLLCQEVIKYASHGPQQHQGHQRSCVPMTPEAETPTAKIKERYHGGHASIDSLIHELGDCGLFQVLMVAIVHGAAIPAGWSTVFMSYGNYNPGWTCYQTESNSSNWVSKNENHSMVGNGSYVLSAHSEMPPTSCAEYTTCSDVVYSKGASTIVTEWNLACDKSYILSMMLSIQVGGYTLGTLIAGVLNNIIGRKLTHVIGLAFHTILNVIASFSVDWPMFTACYFFIGMTSGSISVCNYMYPMEFVTSKWRAIVTALPISSLGNTLFALLAMATRDWRILHQLTAVVTATLLLSALWAPESVRWLALKGNTDKAVCVTRKIAKWNRNEAKNIDAIHSLIQHEQNLEKERKGYSFLDLYRHGLLKRTIIITYSWGCMVICVTVVMFDIKSLSGNFYLNMALFNLIPIVSLLLLPVMANKLGRKLTSLILIGLSCFCCAGLLTLDVVPEAFHGGSARIVLSLLFMAFVDAILALLMLYVVELYPTPLRSLGYSNAECLSSIGGMLAAFLVPHDETTTFISHVVVTCLLVVNWGSVFLLPETKDRHLEDYIPLEEE